MHPTRLLLAVTTLVLAGCGANVAPLTPPRLGPTTVSAASTVTKPATTGPIAFKAALGTAQDAKDTRSSMYMGTVGNHRVSISLFNGNCQMSMDGATYDGNSMPGTTMGWVRPMGNAGQMQNVNLRTGQGSMSGFIGSQMAMMNGFSGILNGSVGPARLNLSIMGGFITGQMGGAVATAPDRVMLSGNPPQCQADADGLAAALMVADYLDANLTVAGTKAK